MSSFDYMNLDLICKEHITGDQLFKNTVYSIYLSEVIEKVEKLYPNRKYCIIQLVQNKLHLLSLCDDYDFFMYTIYNNKPRWNSNTHLGYYCNYDLRYPEKLKSIHVWFFSGEQLKFIFNTYNICMEYLHSGIIQNDVNFMDIYEHIIPKELKSNSTLKQLFIDYLNSSDMEKTTERVGNSSIRVKNYNIERCSKEQKQVIQQIWQEHTQNFYKYEINIKRQRTRKRNAYRRSETYRIKMRLRSKLKRICRNKQIRQQHRKDTINKYLNKLNMWNNRAIELVPVMAGNESKFKEFTFLCKKIRRMTTNPLLRNIQLPIKLITEQM